MNDDEAEKETIKKNCVVIDDDRMNQHLRIYIESFDMDTEVIIKKAKKMHRRMRIVESKGKDVMYE